MYEIGYQNTYQIIIDNGNQEMLLNYKILDVHVFYYSYLFKGDTKYGLLYF